jgi:hypothetical protein
VPVGLGLALVTVVGLLAAAAFGRRYRSVGRAGAAGCVGVTALDVTMLIAMPLAVPALAWPVMVGLIASMVRLVVSVRFLRAILVGAMAR